MIIVVDDESDILQYIREILRHVNYEVITATSGDQAWNLFEEHQPEIDMVLTDVVMPGSHIGASPSPNHRFSFSGPPQKLIS
jgi:CheY-like chemotaxis protein